MLARAAAAVLVRLPVKTAARAAAAAVIGARTEPKALIRLARATEHQASAEETQLAARLAVAALTRPLTTEWLAPVLSQAGLAEPAEMMVALGLVAVRPEYVTEYSLVAWAVIIQLLPMPAAAAIRKMP